MTVYSKLNETLCTLEGTAATLELYSVRSNHQDINNTFLDAAQSIKEVAKDLRKRIGDMESEEPQYKGQ